MNVGYIVTVETFNLPFQLDCFASNNPNAGFAYYQEDVIGSGTDHFIFWCVNRLTINKFQKLLISKGVPKDQIGVYKISS